MQSDKEAKGSSGQEPLVVDTGKKKSDGHLELSFEYLVAKNKLQWVTIKLMFSLFSLSNAVRQRG